MNKTPKNLKHGYIFLTGVILVLFSISFATEMYLNGAFAFDDVPEVQKKIQPINEKADSEKLFVEVQNLDEGFLTEDSEITIVVFTNKGNQAWINQNEVKVDDQGTFEGKVDLIVGDNEILIKVVSQNGDELQKVITVIREKVEEQSKEETKEDPKPTEIQTKPITSPVENSPTPKTDPVPTPEPVELPLTGLKIQCSITNTQPSISQSVSISCNVTDQSNKAISSATGNITVNWQSGVQTYQLSSSNNSGMTSKSFVVPEGNNGSVSGVVKISKSGLTVTSNFSLVIQ